MTGVCHLLPAAPAHSKLPIDSFFGTVTLFRFLRRCEFVVPTALALMLATIQWRLKENIDSFRYDQMPIELKEAGLVFFRNYDKLNRPIAYVRLRQFPKFSQGSLLDNVKPLLYYVMETARKLTRDLTKQREQENMQNSFTSQIAVVIDIKSAPLLPFVRFLLAAVKKPSRSFTQQSQLVISLRTPNYQVLSWISWIIGFRDLWVACIS